MTKTPEYNVDKKNDNINQIDEIDLIEIFHVIWEGKWLIGILCAVSVIGSVYYALNAQQWWIAKGQVIEPQLTDVATLYQQSKAVSVILNNPLHESKYKNKAHEFDALFEPKILFSLFVRSFNSASSKKCFCNKMQHF